MFGIPPLSFASKSCPWATREAPIESQTQTVQREIPFSENELVAPEKKLNQKIKMEKKGRGALLRSSQVGKLLFEKPSHRVYLAETWLTVYRQHSVISQPASFLEVHSGIFSPF